MATYSTTIDPYSKNFKTNGLYKRILELMNGNETLASNWWVTPNTYFNMKTPSDQMNEDWTVVRQFILNLKRNSQFDTNVGVTDGLYIKDPAVNEILDGFVSEHAHNYQYDYKTRAAEFYMNSLRTKVGSFSRVYRANRGLNSGLNTYDTYVESRTGKVRFPRGRNNRNAKTTDVIMGPPNDFK